MPGEAIEGIRIKGHSRDPLRMLGARPVEMNGIRCYRFVADFDAVARIDKELPAGTPKIIPSSLVSEGDNVLCQKAIIYATKRRYKSEGVKPTTGRHKANHWTFSFQTAVQIEFGHEQIVMAVQTRKESEKSKGTPALPSGSHKELP